MHRCPGLLRPKRRHELEEVRLPQSGIVMAEMAVRVGTGWEQHIAAVLDALHRPLDGAELRRVGVVLGVVNQQHLGCDLVEVGLGIIVLDRLDRPELVVGVALRRLGEPALVERVGGGQGRRPSPGCGSGSRW